MQSHAVSDAPHAMFSYAVIELPPVWAVGGHWLACNVGASISGQVSRPRNQRRDCISDGVKDLAVGVASRQGRTGFVDGKFIRPIGYRRTC